MTFHRSGPAAAGAVLLVVLWGVSVTARASAMGLDDRVRELYDAAEYEQALAALGTADDPDAQQYRALCLLALGKQDQAEASLQALVTASPGFVVSAEEMPPRFVALLGRVRRQLVPTMLRRQYNEARALFQKKAYEDALAAFEQVMALSAPDDIRSAEGIEDLRLLAAGFVDLATSARSSAAPAAARAAATPSAPRTVTTTPPVARRQVIPPWPGEAGQALMTRTGAVRVTIGSTGRVLSAAMVRPIHPAYDRRVLEAVRLWEYTPAMLNGVAVESESTVEIRVQPPGRE